jgi:hypothetical protein
LLSSQIAVLLTGSTTLSSGTWYKVGFRIGAGSTATIDLLLNGAVEATGTTSGTFNINNSNMSIGVDRYNSNTQTAENLNGDVDEFMLIDAVVSNDWIAFGYQDDINNSNDFTTFPSACTFYVDSQESIPVTLNIPPLIHSFAKPRGANF